MILAIGIISDMFFCFQLSIKASMVKWGQAPLALVFLSLVSMLSITIPHFNGFEAYCSRTAALKSTAQQAAATFWRLPPPFRSLIAAAEYLGSGASGYRGIDRSKPWYWSE